MKWKTIKIKNKKRLYQIYQLYCKFQGRLEAVFDSATPALVSLFLAFSECSEARRSSAEAAAQPAEEPVPSAFTPHSLFLQPSALLVQYPRADFPSAAPAPAQLPTPGTEAPAERRLHPLKRLSVSWAAITPWRSPWSFGSLRTWLMRSNVWRLKVALRVLNSIQWLIIPMEMWVYFCLWKFRIIGLWLIFIGLFATFFFFFGCIFTLFNFTCPLF